jgi:hypothetical protein
MYEEAVREDAWKGGGHPDLIPRVERNLKDAETALVNYVRELEKRVKDERDDQTKTD